MKKFLRYFVNLILVAILIYSGYNIYSKLSEYKKADAVYEDIRAIKDDNEESEFSELSDINSDYRFWLNVENTNIDYPVVQGKDNDYYLTRDFNKNYLASGSVFMDYRNDFTRDKSVIVYAHHMRNKTMFGELANFKRENFFKSNNKITIEQDGKSYTYEVFSVYVADFSDDYLKVDFTSDDDYENYIDYIVDRSLFKSGVDVSSDDNILTLYTCSYEFKDARTIVHAKRIP
ncbi:MAG: class B sortase [Peptostreptococcaceae bacterium]